MLCIAAFALQLLHLLLVAHTTCPTHHEVIHGESHTGNKAVANVSDLAIAASLPDTQGAAHEDDHCLVALETRKQDRIGSSGPLVHGIAPVALGPARLYFEAQTDRGARPPLNVAPKTSPPAAV